MYSDKQVRIYPRHRSPDPRSHVWIILPSNSIPWTTLMNIYNVWRTMISLRTNKTNDQRIPKYMEIQLRVT